MDQNTIIKYIQDILKNKRILLPIVVVLVAVFFGISLFGKYSTNSVYYKNQIQEQTQKLNDLEALKKSKEELIKYTTSFLKHLDSESLLNQLTDYATQNDIAILNISPGQTSVKDDFSMSNIRLNISAKTFKNLIAFFYTIESSEYVFRITSWSGDSQAENGVFNCVIDIVLVQMK